jgi:integrase
MSNKYHAVFRIAREQSWYGMGLMKCMSLLIQDIYFFPYHRIMVRNGKGRKDKVVSMPHPLEALMKAHMEEVRRIHEENLTQGFGEVYMSDALGRKFPKEASGLPWQYVFLMVGCPLTLGVRSSSVIMSTKAVCKKAVQRAARETGITKRVSCHALRHFFARSCWRMATISARCKRCWGTRMSLPL